MLKGFIYLFLSVVLLSCKKDNLKADVSDSTSFSKCFDIFWKKMESRYSFWDIDTTNWDLVYLRYKPLFDSLDINKESDNRQAFQYFSEMAAPLLDKHFSITFSNSFLSNFIIYPSYEEKHRAGFFPVSYLAIDTTYLDTDYSFGNDERTVINGKPAYAVCGTIGREIIYFSCNYFHLYDYYTSSQGNAIRPVLNQLFNLLSRHDLKGIILDLRNNPGGDIQDLNFLVGHLTTVKHAFGFSKYKIGNSPLDFTPWMESFINPVSGAVDFKKSKIVLTDRYSASLSELVTMAVRSLPNSIVVGDTTWGATAFIADDALYNAGSFEVKDFMKVTAASGAFRYVNNVVYEGVGFPPDIQIPYVSTPPNSRKDASLEKAIEIIKTNP